MKKANTIEEERNDDSRLSQAEEVRESKSRLTDDTNLVAPDKSIIHKKHMMPPIPASNSSRQNFHKLNKTEEKNNTKPQRAPPSKAVSSMAKIGNNRHEEMSMDNMQAKSAMLRVNDSKKTDSMTYKTHTIEGMSTRVASNLGDKQAANKKAARPIETAKTNQVNQSIKIGSN